MAADSSGELLFSLLNHAAPQLTRQDLAPLNDSPAVLNALLLLVRTHPAQGGDRERWVAEQKVASLRTSLSHLTSHLNLLSNRLAASESALSSLRLLHHQQLSRVEEERDGLRALCGVWEGRWREERRLREAEELIQKLSSGRALNDRHSRMETSYTALKPIPPPISRSRRSSSASSSSSSSDVTRLTTSQPPRKRSQPGHAPVASTSASAPRLRTRQIVADLARELERVRREADRLLFERDEEIARLEADQSMRRREMAELYSSLDTLLGLAGRVDLGSPQDASLPPDSPALDIPPPTTTTKGKGKAHVRNGSILDLPAVRAAAAHSKNDGETAALEEEVRELEREIARLDGRALPSSGGGSSSVVDESSGPELSPARGGEDRHLHLTIRELNSQVAQLRHELEEARHERSTLRKLYEGPSNGSRFAPAAAASESSGSSAAALQGIQDERDRLTHLLRTAESANATLHSELITTRSHFEDVSERVRLKLLEQKGKLEACYQEMEALGEALEESERAVEKERARRKIVEELLGWEKEQMGRRGSETEERRQDPQKQRGSA